jgi:hypothetical protein
MQALGNHARHDKCQLGHDTFDDAATVAVIGDWLLAAGTIAP